MTAPSGLEGGWITLAVWRKFGARVSLFPPGNSGGGVILTLIGRFTPAGPHKCHGCATTPASSGEVWCSYLRAFKGFSWHHLNTYKYFLYACYALRPPELYLKGRLRGLAYHAFKFLHGHPLYCIHIIFFHIFVIHIYIYMCMIRVSTRISAWIYIYI